MSTYQGPWYSRYLLPLRRFACGSCPWPPSQWSQVSRQIWTSQRWPNRLWLKEQSWLQSLKLGMERWRWDEEDSLRWIRRWKIRRWRRSEERGSRAGDQGPRVVRGGVMDVLLPFIWCLSITRKYLCILVPPLFYHIYYVPYLFYYNPLLYYIYYIQYIIPFHYTITIFTSNII